MAGQLGKFLGELKQRHVFRVALAYIVVAWVVMQAAALIKPALHLPDWFDTAIDVALVLGFAPAVVIAWSASPARREPQEPPPESADSSTSQLPQAVPPPAHQKIQYCKALDGTRIAYATLGKGPPIVKAANWMTHLELDWNAPLFSHWYSGLCQDHMLIRYDERGCGLSDWDTNDISHEAFVQDLEAVVDAAQAERFALIGISQGCMVSIDYAVRHPERVACLILFGGFQTGQRRLNDPKLEKQFDALKSMIEFHWGTDNPAFRQYFTSLFYPDASPEEMTWYNELQRRSVSPQNAARIIEAVSTVDVADLLPKVQAPTLVLHVVDDAIAPFAQARALAAGITGARLVPLEGRNHVLLEHDPAWPKCVQEVREFLADHWPGSV